MELKIKLNNVNDAVLFVAKCNEFKEYDIDVIYNRYIIDAKSLMGVLSIGTNECHIELHVADDDFETQERFRKAMKLWIQE